MWQRFVAALLAYCLLLPSMSALRAGASVQTSAAAMPSVQTTAPPRPLPYPVINAAAARRAAHAKSMARPLFAPPNVRQSHAVAGRRVSGVLVRSVPNARVTIHDARHAPRDPLAMRRSMLQVAAPSGRRGIAVPGASKSLQTRMVAPLSTGSCSAPVQSPPTAIAGADATTASASIS